MAAAAVLTVVHGSHEDTSATLFNMSAKNSTIKGFWNSKNTHLGLRALSPQTFDLSIGIDLVVLEDGQLGLLPLVLDLLGGTVDLLLPLLGTTT
jgi:hypothetical protein